jgi:hypothetical protein
MDLSDLLVTVLSPLQPLYLVDDLSSEWLSLYEWWRPHVVRVASSSRLRNGGPNRRRNGLGWLTWANRPKPTSAPFGRLLFHVGPLAILHLDPFNYVILAMASSRPR